MHARTALVTSHGDPLPSLPGARTAKVRHSVFVLGTAGAAKSELWKTLAAAQTYLQIGGGRTQFDALNPKAVTSNELYGYVHPVTKEPYDGIIAKIMRDFAAQTNDQPKWMVLDGDIDAEWIESMNTVMDDNKILTLTTNERIPLSPSMRTQKPRHIHYHSSDILSLSSLPQACCSR